MLLSHKGLFSCNLFFLTFLSPSIRFIILLVYKEFTGRNPSTSNGLFQPFIDDKARFRDARYQLNDNKHLLVLPVVFAP
jgi:hypothetical protein